MSDERTWRERHPFLYGLSMTFGIFQVRRDVEAPEEGLRRSFRDVEAAIAEAEKQLAMRDYQRARDLFADRSRYVEGVGIVGPAIHEDALLLLKSDPEEYFRLSQLWRSGLSGQVPTEEPR